MRFLARLYARRIVNVNVNVVTAGFVAFVVYGFDCASDFETFAPGYSTKIPVAPAWPRVTSQPLWNGWSV